MQIFCEIIVSILNIVQHTQLHKKIARHEERKLDQHLHLSTIYQLKAVITIIWKIAKEKKFLALKAFPVFCASVKRDNSCIDHRLVKMTSTASSRGTKKRYYFDWTRCCVSSNRFLGNEIPNIMCRSGMFARCLIYPTDAIRL